MHRRVIIALSALAFAGFAAGCGSEVNNLKTGSNSYGKLPQQYQPGAKLFVDRCSGCHDLGVVGAEGGALQIKGRERTDGPNFNVRHETVDSVLFAIRNGGFSRAIMPQDIVVGQDAQNVAVFLARYAGHGKKNDR